jgi:hypothetical protein
MWGRPIAQEYSDIVGFVGLCDINPKRVEAAKQLIGVTDVYHPRRPIRVASRHG